MLPQFLLPESVAHVDGSGVALALDAERGRPLLLTLGIIRIMERASLDVSIWGSADDKEWQPLAVFPQKYYCGKYSLTLDLSRSPEVRYLRAQWKMGRWGGAEAATLAGFYVFAEPVQVRAASAV